MSLDSVIKDHKSC